MIPNLKQQIVAAIVWDFLGKVAIQGSNFIVSIFLARLLTPVDFGLVAIVMVVFNIMSIFIDTGLGSSLIQRKRLLPIHYNSVFYFNILAAVALWGIIMSNAHYIAAFYHQQALELIVQVMSITLLLGALTGIHNAIFIKELSYKLLAKINFISFSFGGILGIVLALSGYGVWSLVFQNIVGGVIKVILTWYYSLWRPKLLFSYKALKQLWGFGFRMFMSSILNKIYEQMDYIIIGKIFSPATLGFFQRAKALDTLIINYSSGSIMQVMFPVLSKVQQDADRFKNIVFKALGLILFMVFLLIGFFYLNAQEVIIILFSEKWLPSVEMFKILVLSSFAYPISALMVNVLSGKGNSKAFLKLEIYKKIVLTLTFLVGFYFGIKGYLYGLIVFSVIAVYLNIAFAAKEIDVKKIEFIKPIIIQFAIMLISILIVLSIMHYMLIIKNLFVLLILKGSLFFIIYIVINQVLKTTSFVYVKDELSNVLLRRKLNV